MNNSINHTSYLEYKAMKEDALDHDEERIASRNKSTKKNGMRRSYYPSNVPQSLIVNGATGVPYPYRVGSKEQAILYKMVDATGTCDTEGFFIRTGLKPSSRDDEEVETVFPNPNPNHLFFDSPEQCMTHLRVSIAPKDVARWHETRRPADALTF
jgi:hypothetical protein